MTEKIVHPLYQEEVSLRFAYVLGLEIFRKELEGDNDRDFPELLGLPGDYAERLHSMLSNMSEDTLLAVREALLSSGYRHMFLLDLCLIAAKTPPTKSHSSDLIEEFRIMLEISYDEFTQVSYFSQLVNDNLVG